MPTVQRTVERLRLALVMLVLTLAVFGQSAGNAATDTKFDLVVSPLRFLGRALRLWDPIGNAGQLQNQAYGYLFPMGPFFSGLHALGVAPWEIQRAWEAAIIVAGFLGTYLVARRIGVDGFWPAVGAGLAYALAPRMIGELTSISSELMPVAALPWVLLPLIRASSEGSPRRAAARSGVALLFAGGVNAAATLAILPVPALWLLTRSRGPRRRSLMAWWSGAAVLACAWWLVPLLQLGRYSPPFLDWIESSSTTSLPTSLLATLRGVDHWESYLGPSIWPGAWILASSQIAVVATTAVAAAGLVGLSRRDVPHRLFLWTSLLLGLVLVTFGHAASVGPPAAGTMRALLDGALVPFRNVHKFDPLVRLPLALGLGFVLARTRVPREVVVGHGRSRIQLPARALAAIAVIGIGLVAVSPVLTNRLVSSQRITTEPRWWAATAKWLAANSHGARALVVPGSGSPHYVWGGTIDNALQPVATTPWTVRDSVPLAQAGYIRLLDTIEAILAKGAADADLAPLLTRAGIGYVVIANDLESLASLSTPMLFVRATLDSSPGITLRAGLGPKVGGTLSRKVLLDSGATVSHPSVQVYGVTGWDGIATLQPLSGAVVATGSTDALPQLLRRGLGSGTPVLFGSDAKGVPVESPVTVTTDGIRRREASFAGQVDPPTTMTARQPFSIRRPAHDYLPDGAGPLSAFEYIGIADVTASTSGADRLAYVNRGELNGPWSALDGDPTTSWKSSSFAGAVGQWLRVEFNDAITVPTVEVTFAAGFGALPTSLSVRTDTGTVLVPVLPTTTPQSVVLPQGGTRSVTLTVAGLADHTRGGSVAVASLTIPGLTAARTLRVPSLPSADVFAFDAVRGSRAPCLEVAMQAVCDPHYARPGQEDGVVDRTFAVTEDRGEQYVPSATVRLKGGASLDAVLDRGATVSAQGSSTNSDDPRQRPGAAVDGDPTTTWQAAPGDATPHLTLHLGTVATIPGITLITPTSAPVAAPRRVTVDAGEQQWSGLLPFDGHITFDAPAHTDTVDIRIDETQLRASTDTLSLTTRLLAVGISEVAIDGLPLHGATGPVDIGCDAGVTLDVDGRPIPLQVNASRADVLAGRAVAAQACGGVTVGLDNGEHRVVLPAGAAAAPASVTLTRVGALIAPTPSAGGIVVRHWGATDRRVDVDTAAASLLVVRENANAGWRATLHGKRLKAVRVDGWQQAFVVPAGSHGTIALTYAPQRPFVIGLVAGALAALAVVVLAVVRPGRGDQPELADGRLPAPLLAVLFAGAIGLLGGWLALLTAAVLTVLAVLLARVRPVPAWAGGALLLAAAFVVARAERLQVFARQNDALPQLLCIAALAAGVLASVTLPRHGREP